MRFHARCICMYMKNEMMNVKVCIARLCFNDM
jgi:hypothetical protein